MIILCLGDLHAPFVHKPSVSKVLDFLSEMKPKPDYIVQLGDGRDLFSYSRFPKLQKILPEWELSEGTVVLEEIWGAIQRRAPKAKCIQLLGNHCVRVEKAVKEKFPEIHSLVDFDSLWKFSGVHVHREIAEPLKIDKYFFMHGYLSGLGAHARKFQRNVVCGHTHKGGVAVVPIYDVGSESFVTELNCGHLADPEHEALKYTPLKWTGWTHGVGLIDRYGERFIQF